MADLKMCFLTLTILCRFSSQQENNLLNLKINEPQGLALTNVLNPVVGLLKRDRSTTTAAPTTVVMTTSSPADSYPFRSVTTTEKIAFRMKPKTHSCGRRQIPHVGLITSGSPTKPGDWPWHVAIYKMKTSSSEQKYICGGTLISRTRVVTAGHCVIESGSVVLPERLYAVVGKHNLAGGDIASQEKSVFEIVLHPDFSPNTLENDIAILKLSSKVSYSEYVQPICLWDKDDTARSTIIERYGTVVGWGFTQLDTLSSELLKARIPVQKDLTCIKSNPSFYSRYLTESTFCAGFANGTGACNGDSGGGMYFATSELEDDETWQLRGIVSLTVSRKDKNICDSNYYTIFTDAAQYLDFIDSYMGAGN